MPNVIATNAQVGQRYQLDTINDPASLEVIVQAASAASIAPLARAMFVDSASTEPSENGSVAAPFKSIGGAVAALAATGGVLLIVPGDYSVESTISLNTDHEWHLVAVDFSTVDSDTSNTPLTQLPDLSLEPGVGPAAAICSVQHARVTTISCPVETTLFLDSCSVGTVSANPSPSGDHARLVARNCSLGSVDSMASMDLLSCSVTAATYSTISGGNIRLQDLRGASAIMTAPSGQIRTDNASLPAVASTTGTVTILGSTAPNVSFSPATPGNWLPVPADVKTALDQLATPKASMQSAGALGPATSISFTTSAVTPVASGTYLILGTGTGLTVSAAIGTHILQVDGVTVATMQTDSAANRPFNFTIPWVAALSNASNHTFTVQSSASAGNMTATAGSYRVILLELGA